VYGSHCFHALLPPLSFRLLLRHLQHLYDAWIKKLPQCKGKQTKEYKVCVIDHCGLC
jgi:hypothetical protein